MFIQTRRIDQGSRSTSEAKASMPGWTLERREESPDPDVKWVLVFTRQLRPDGKIRTPQRNAIET